MAQLLILLEFRMSDLEDDSFQDSASEPEHDNKRAPGPPPQRRRGPAIQQRFVADFHGPDKRSRAIAVGNTEMASGDPPNIRNRNGNYFEATTAYMNADQMSRTEVPNRPCEVLNS